MNTDDNDLKEKQMMSNTGFKNVKSNVILKKIFDIIKMNKKYNILRYNKTLQKRLNLGFNDYKELSQLFFSPIEIELIPTDYRYGKFINISEYEKIFYHIFFDDSYEEIYRNYLQINDDVKKIKIVIDYPITSFHDLFWNCECIKSITFTKFYRINIYDMSNMFHYCSSLEELNLTNFVTNNVTNMKNMFAYCLSLKELNLSSFNTTNVKDM